MQHLTQCSEEDLTVLTSIYETVSSLSVKQVEENELFDLRALRLDWFRLQAYSSSSVSSARSFQLMDHTDLAFVLNDISFRSKLVDYLDELLVETSDLSQFCFYNRLFEDNFHMCLEFPAQNRYGYRLGKRPVVKGFHQRLAGFSRGQGSMVGVNKGTENVIGLKRSKKKRAMDLLYCCLSFF
jgi:hypothetical protein